MKTKKAVVVLTLLNIASLFIIGADWASEPIRQFYHSYFADIAIPFGYYFLLVLIEDKFKPLRKWYYKSASIFTLCAISETLQYFGIYALARVFDPLDYLMYALGALLAAFTDRVILKRLISFWK